MNEQLTTKQIRVQIRNLQIQRIEVLTDLIVNNPRIPLETMQANIMRQNEHYDKEVGKLSRLLTKYT